ncbi:uncharacterized protein LOC108677919 [Hyalella azteca]|uniref:Uncharacterized protein LOC108677919 n=1 Tax=Hyalella azteca TaxID=294128 RepID=A0A8B7P783_HYAAZ|nr:uncharacterized protein LOC108677919 [Hyalella azteca]
MMREAYAALPTDENDADDQDDIHERITHSCMDTLKAMMPNSLAGVGYHKVDNEDPDVDTQDCTPTHDPSCFDSVLDAVPSLRSHYHYRPVQIDDNDDDEEEAIFNECNLVSMEDRNGLPPDAIQQLHFEDRLHLLSTAHGVHRVEVPYHQTGGGRRVPLGATARYGRNLKHGTQKASRFISGVTKRMTVVGTKVRAVSWRENTQLFVRWLLNCRRVLVMVTLTVIIALLSIIVWTTKDLSMQFQRQHLLVLDLKKKIDDVGLRLDRNFEDQSLHFNDLKSNAAALNLTVSDVRLNEVLFLLRRLTPTTTLTSRDAKFQDVDLAGPSANNQAVSAQSRAKWQRRSDNHYSDILATLRSSSQGLSGGVISSIIACLVAFFRQRICVG